MPVFLSLSCFAQHLHPRRREEKGQRVENSVVAKRLWTVRTHHSVHPELFLCLSFTISPSSLCWSDYHFIVISIPLFLFCRIRNWGPRPYKCCVAETICMSRQSGSTANASNTLFYHHSQVVLSNINSRPLSCTYFFFLK